MEKIQKLVDMPLDELIFAANKERKKYIGNKIEVCGIVNAKSGRCTENCKFCAQSAHHSASTAEFPLKNKSEIVAAAIEARNNGAARFGIVTSGRKLSSEEIAAIAEAVTEILDKTDISLCASLGSIDEGSFKVLLDAGLTRYHHNLETSRRFYPEIVTTHDYDERVNTVVLAKKMGMEVCSGGIFGLGETWEDRIDMALLLNELEVDSVPLNFLVPVKGTPMENAPEISALDAVRIIAVYRMILKDRTIKVVAGRESILKDFQGMMYSAGANGMMIGGYLTVNGRAVSEDAQLISEIRKLWKEV